MTYEALFFYTLGLWAFSGIRVVVSAFFALQDTKTPVKAAILAFFFHLIFSLVLMGPFRHGGLALALSLASSFQFFFLLYCLKRKFHVGSLKPAMISSVKCALAAAVMGIGVFYLHDLWLTVDSPSPLWHRIFNLTGLIAAGMILYFGVARILGCSEWGSLREMVRPFFGRGKGERGALRKGA